MQYIPCNNALLVQETLLLSQRSTLCEGASCLRKTSATLWTCASNQTVTADNLVARVKSTWSSWDDQNKHIPFHSEKLVVGLEDVSYFGGALVQGAGWDLMNIIYFLHAIIWQYVIVSKKFISADRTVNSTSEEKKGAGKRKRQAAD